MTLAQARRLTYEYEGDTYFSPSGGTLWVMLKYWNSLGFKCTVAKIYEDTGQLIGYTVSRQH